MSGTSIIRLVLVLLLSVAAVWAASQGPLTAGTGTSVPDGTNNDWINPGNITADDGSFASVNLSDAEVSDWLYASNFGFTIPGGNEIKGIEFTSKRQKSGVSGENCLDSLVFVVKGGSRVGNDHSNPNFWLHAAYETVTYGNPTDTWSANPWTVSEVNATGFGIQIQAVGSVTTFSPNCIVDVVTATVNYGPPAGRMLITETRTARTYVGGR